MTREEQLVYCKICRNQRFSMNHGVICGFTNEIASFEGTCNLFEEDINLVKGSKSTNGKSNGALASQGKRFANYLLDSIFYLIFWIIVAAIFGFILAIVSPSSLSLLDGDNDIINYVIGVISLFVYYSTLEAIDGRTIAKYITKTKVVNENGTKPDYGTILLRTICRFIPFDALSFLVHDKSGWHDTLSKTKVVEA